MIAAALPDNAGYVVAAYLVLVALLLVYVGIMAFKITRLERDVTELNELADAEIERNRDPDRERTPA